MLINKLPDDSPQAQAHRDVVHGGHQLGGLQVYAIWDNGWHTEPQALTCRLCAWPKGAAQPRDPAVLDAITAHNNATRAAGNPAGD